MLISNIMPIHYHFISTRDLFRFFFRQFVMNFFVMMNPFAMLTTVFAKHLLVKLTCFCENSRFLLIIKYCYLYFKQVFKTHMIDFII